MSVRLGAAAAALILTLTLAASVAASTDRRLEGAHSGSDAATPASDLRITLGRLLGEHAFLVMQAMRLASQGGAAFDALESGLADNSRDLADAIGSVYGPDAKTAFGPIWQQHIDAMFDWARARSAGDAAAADKALAAMQAYRTAFDRFLTSANPKISGDAESHALQLHLDQLTSFLGMDYAQAFATERAAYMHMFHFGDDLAKAIVAQFPARYPDGNVAFSPRTSLRLDLGRLFGEHLVVAAEAMRAGLTGRPDQDAAARSLRANAGDLADIIARVFGTEAGAAFDDVWSRHIDSYLRYIAAVRTGDAAKRAAALGELHAYHGLLARFLHGAIPALGEEQLATLISQHVTALINQVDAAAAGDEVRSVAVVRDAYRHMFVVGDALGNAIADQFPERFGDVRKVPPTNTAAGPLNGPGSWAVIAAGVLSLLFIARRVMEPRR
jgi:hypothetical protein